ncbi:MAG: MarR family winged helix-turn-helix transcriptional regulator [Pyrinomonadaceae bacterium]
MLEIGLHAGQVMVLESLWETDCQSQTDLVRRLSVTPPTVYNLAVKLAKSGFVEIKKCETDGRLMRVCLLQKGINIKSSVKTQWEKLENSIVGKLSETEKLMFSLLLKKIRQGAENLP